MLISVHVPKCAGTSFRHILQALYGDRLWPNYGTIFTRAQARPGLVPAGATCIHGHFFADAFDEIVPDRRLISWVRHPVERVVSNYYHFLRSPDLRDDCCRQLLEAKLTLRQFAELDWMRNETTRYLADKPLADFDFVGIAERFTESLAVFARIFGWDCPLLAPCTNVNPARIKANYALTHADYAHLRDLNAADLAWYDQAVSRLDVSMDRLGVCAA